MSFTNGAIHIEPLCLSLSVLHLGMCECMHTAVYTYMFVFCECMCLIVCLSVCWLLFCVLVFAWAPVCLTVQCVWLFLFQHPPHPLCLANPHSLFSPFFYHPFTLPHPHPLSLSPSSSLCNNSADLVSACSGLPVEFYSGLPSWLLCCLKTQAEKHDWGFFILSHQYGLTLSPFLSPFRRPKKNGPILNK